MNEKEKNNSSIMINNSIGYEKLDEDIVEELDGIKYPTYPNINLIDTNPDNINILKFLDKINKTLQFLITLQYDDIEVLSPKNSKVYSIIKEYNIPFYHYFYIYQFISREITLISIIYSNFHNNMFNMDNETFFSTIKLQYIDDHLSIEDYYNTISNKFPDYFTCLTNEEIYLLKHYMLSLLSIEKNFILSLEKNIFKAGLIPFNVYLEHLGMLLSIIQSDFSLLKSSSFSEDHLIIVYFSDQRKLEISALCLLNYYSGFPITDLFNIKENELTWKNIKQHFKRLIPFSKEEMDKVIQRSNEYVALGFASMSSAKPDKEDGNLKKLVKFGVYGAFYLVNSNKALVQSKKFLMEPEFDITLSFFNLLDIPVVKKMVKIFYPQIEYKETFFIKRNERPIDINVIEMLSKISQNFDGKNGKENRNKLNSIGLKTKFTQISPSIIFKKDSKTKNTNDEYIRVKLYHYEKLYNNIEEYEEKTKNNFGRNSLIFHIHGGGFVAMKPDSHENYTRKWAMKLKIPLISIDYRLSPEYAFPAALDDCYQVYIWVLNNFQNIFNMKIDNIILAGDSAGGNLCISLTYILILLSIKLPSSIFLFYPALRMDLNTPRLSHLNSISETLLGYHFLKFCVESYLGDGKGNGNKENNRIKRKEQSFLICSDISEKNNDKKKEKNSENNIISIINKDNNKEEFKIDTKNVFFSPIFMSDNVLKFLPNIRIFSGSGDPLRDDCLYLLDRLIKLKKDAEILEFKYFPHGFLSYDIKPLFEGGEVINDIVIEEMNKCINT